MPNILKSARAILALGLWVAAIVGTGATAADIRAVSTEACSILLDGDIVAGDAEKLASVIGGIAADAGPRRTLCMNSGGGNLVEGIAIADLIGVHRLATLVPSGAECLSACALAFMFGRVSAEEGSAIADRSLHYSARLGFHRPAVRLPAEAQYSAEQTAGYFNAAFEAMLEFFEISQQRATIRGPAFPWSLFSEMLAYQGPGAMFYVDTAYKAILWDIRVVGFDHPAALSDTGFARACATAENIVLRGAEPFRDFRLEPGGAGQVDGVVVEGDDWRMSSGSGWLGEGGWPCEIWHVEHGGAQCSAGYGLNRLCFGDARMRSGECFEHFLLGVPPTRSSSIYPPYRGGSMPKGGPSWLLVVPRPQR